MKTMDEKSFGKEKEEKERVNIRQEIISSIA